MNSEYEKKYKLNQIIQISDDISNIWRDLNTHNIQRLNEVWKDSITQEYIDKYGKINTNIETILANLDNLKKCWENYQSTENNGDYHE